MGSLRAQLQPFHSAAVVASALARPLHAERNAGEQQGGRAADWRYFVSWLAFSSFPLWAVAGRKG